MAVLRCSKCQFLKEVANQYIGKTTKCPHCQQTATVVETVPLIKEVMNQFLLLSQVHQTLEQNYGKLQTKLNELVDKHIQLNRERNTLQSQLELLQESSKSETEVEVDTDFHTGYAFEYQDYADVLNDFQPIINWFGRRNIQVHPNDKGSDISGYFDEIAVMLGDNLEVLTELLDGIRYRQRKGFEKFNLELNKYNKETVKIIKKFCQTAYEFAFFAKYHFKKQNNSIFLLLNNSPQIERFFDGEWLEWYSFMKVASFLVAKKQKFACLRSSRITFTDSSEYNEIDTFFLINQKQPLWIECKSGEFRDSINKYQELRKRLNIDPRYTILLVSGLEDEKANAMSSMFKLTIVNEKTLLKYIAGLLNL